MKNHNSEQPKKEQDTSLFTQAVNPLLDILKKCLPNEKVNVSDVRDWEGKQYVDLVQEGGGVHGIALAGYTYVLEKMGIGFMKMAGTSAGSINTLLLNSVYTKNEADKLKKDPSKYYDTRSEKLLYYLANKDISEFIDGHPSWRKLILNLFESAFITATKARIKVYAVLGGLSLIILLLSGLLLALYTADNGLHLALRWITALSSIVFLAILMMTVGKLIAARLLYKHAERFGINPGDDFEKWIDKILKDNGIESVHDLNEKLMTEQREFAYKFQPVVDSKNEDPETIERKNNLRNRIDFTALLNKIADSQIKEVSFSDEIFNLLTTLKENTPKDYAPALDIIMEAFRERMKAESASISRELVIVTSDVTHGIKVEFPGMHRMYWGTNYSFSPSKYVRASMSVPLFFKPMKVDFNVAEMNVINEEWDKLLRVRKTLEPCALFVDGGLLSNFPLNVFYNANYFIPRKPTFGIQLEYEDESLPKNIHSLLGFLGSMISTMRFFFDRDFNLKHAMYQKTVRSVDTGTIFWLNFNMTEKQKVELFFRGALSAAIFLSRHVADDETLQQMMQLGKNVPLGKEESFSIYPDDTPNFRTEDFLMTNVTFEWNEYKKERLLDSISTDTVKKEQSAMAKPSVTIETKESQRLVNPAEKK